MFGHVQQHPPNSSPFFVFISALHPRFDFKFFSRRNGVKLEERICCQTHISHHLVWYFKPSRREAGLRSLRDREGTKLAIDFLFFCPKSRSLSEKVSAQKLLVSWPSCCSLDLSFSLCVCVLWWCLEKKRCRCPTPPLDRLLLTVDTCSLRTKEREKRSFRERGPSVHRNTPVNQKKEEKKGGG